MIRWGSVSRAEGLRIRIPGGGNGQMGVGETGVAPVSGDAALLERLIDLARRIRDRLAERCEAEGVSASRFAVLKEIAAADTDGCSQTELARRLRLSESNVCALVERMRAAGLLYRFRSKADRRRSVLMLSERGRDLADVVRRVQAIEAASLVSVWDAVQRRELGNLLDEMHRHLEQLPGAGERSVNEINEDPWGPAANEPAGTGAGAKRISRRAS